MGILTKQKFIDYINFIKTQYKNQDKFLDGLEALCPACICDAFIYEDYQNKLLDLLSEIMQDNGDDIGFFLFEADYIDLDEKDLNLEMFPRDENDNPYYTSLSTLYDYLESKLY